MNLTIHSLEPSNAAQVEKAHRDQAKAESKPLYTNRLFQGALFGVAFGFLLQKGGVAKYHVLIGALLLEDFTVMKVMLTAIIVGSIGIFSLLAFNLVKLDLKPTRYAANVAGGLLFGVGFGLLGYCPGTGAAALGQGNWDAIFGFAGLLLGSYLFAEFSGLIGKTISKWGDRGKLTLPELVGMKRSTFLLIWLPLLVVVLFAIHALAER
ncbi:MAG: YeeE/YedE family protein [Planctomycetaceae bacterium]|nr:MAG: YeeE/YedE family protein [Planctomycetaceae bacterium]